MAQVGNLGVTVEILSGPAQLTPGGSGTWPARVRRSGSVGAPRAYTLTAFGPLAAFAQISPTAVSWAPGSSQTAQMMISGFDLALAQEYMIGVHARSQTLSHIQAQDTTTVTVGVTQGVQVQLPVLLLPIPAHSTAMANSGVTQDSGSVTLTMQGGWAGDCICASSRARPL